MIARVLVIDGDDATRNDAEFLRSVGFDVTAVSDAHGSTVLALAFRRWDHDEYPSGCGESQYRIRTRKRRDMS